jgi:post-segregation antitoxin (ccd killing protein)
VNDLIKRDFQGVTVTFQGKEGVSLTDLWIASGKDENKAPKYWRRNEGYGFIKTLAETLNVTENHLLKTTRGKSGGTWAHWQIALAYAKYLSPELHIWCNQVVKERLEEERNPELGISRSRERAINSWRRQGKDDQWIEARLKGIATRKVFTGILARHGVNGKGFAKCTNAIYEPMLGDTAAAIREIKGLKPTANVRDNLGNVETIGVMLAEALAGEKIDGRNYRGNDHCASACTVASLTVAKAIKETRRAI